MHAFSASGEALPGLALAPLGHSSHNTRAAAFAEAGNVLFLGEEESDGVLVAADAAPPHALRWRSPPGSLPKCFGLAVLPVQVSLRVGSASDGKQALEHGHHLIALHPLAGPCRGNL